MIYNTNQQCLYDNDQIQKNSLFVTFQFVVNDLNDNDNVIDEWMDII